MTTQSFDQAQHESWAQDFESPAEAEEREAVLTGQIFPILTDAAWTALLDQAAEDFAELTSCGCTDPMCPCVKRWQWPTFPEFVARNL